MTIWPNFRSIISRTACAPNCVASTRSKVVGAPPRCKCPSTTVRVVGCLAQVSGTWVLRNASAPARVRKADTTDAGELERSAQMPAGTSIFRLPNLTDDHSAAELTALGSSKVQVKGVLNGEGANARISVLSFEPLKQNCRE